MSSLACELALATWTRIVNSCHLHFPAQTGLIGEEFNEETIVIDNSRVNNPFWKQTLLGLYCMPGVATGISGTVPVTLALGQRADNESTASGCSLASIGAGMFRWSPS